MFRLIRNWWFEKCDVRHFVIAFVEEFNNNRGRFKVYISKRDRQSILVFDKVCKVFYPVWLRDDQKSCNGLLEDCYSREFIISTVQKEGYTLEDVEWTGFLTCKEESYLYKYCYKVGYDKYMKKLRLEAKLKYEEFNQELLNRYK